MTHVHALSKSDQQLVETFYALKIFTEGKLPDLADAIVVTDAQCGPMSISMNLESQPLATISNIGGALLLADEAETSARAYIAKQVSDLLKNKKNLTLALVALAPSEYMQKIDVDFIRVIDLLTLAEKVCVQGIARRAAIASFLVVRFSDDRVYAYQVDSQKFREWHLAYEMQVLNRQNGALDDDDSTSMVNRQHFGAGAL